MLYGVATYLMIQSGIGISPWDALNQGLSAQVGIRYGDATLIISLVIVLVDLLMREKIGIGTFLDSVLVGKTVDLLDWLDLIPKQTELPRSFFMLLMGLVIGGFALALYMSAGLGCGPRDSLLLGVSRRLPKVPIGMVSMAIFAVVTVLAVILGGGIGIGTVLCLLLQGPIMQLDFMLVKFDAKAVEHQDFLTSLKTLAKKAD